MGVKKRMKSKNWIVCGVVGSVLLIALFIGLFFMLIQSWFADNRDNIAQSINFVLVNEDQGTAFNGVHHNLGMDFISLVNQDPIHMWHTVSRSIAMAGLNSDMYDVMIILPQNFSENLLSFQSYSPERAHVFMKCVLNKAMQYEHIS